MSGPLSEESPKSEKSRTSKESRKSEESRERPATRASTLRMGSALPKRTSGSTLDPDARRGAPRLALGSDPFEALDAPDPFLEGLAILKPEETAAKGLRRVEPIAIAPTPVASAEPARDPEARTEPRPAPLVPRRRWVKMPALEDVEAPDLPSWIRQLTTADERRRLGAIAHLVEGEQSYDRFGLSPEVMQRAFPFVYAIYRNYFRVASEGHSQIPDQGPAILAGNHGGLLPWDAAMVILDVLLKTDPPRLPRAVVDRWAGTLPFVNVFYARMGQVIGTRENFADLLAEGQLMLVFPEGMDGATKPVSQRYRLQTFRVGFIEQALRAQAPVVPVAILGSDDQAPILADLKPLAKRIGLPMIPITPTFPWLGPLGLLPYPVKYRIVYGEPLHFHERFGPEDAEDARLVHALAKQVRYRVQQLVDRNR